MIPDVPSVWPLDIVSQTADKCISIQQLAQSDQKETSQKEY